jgi:hypothetical protein
MSGLPARLLAEGARFERLFFARLGSLFRGRAAQREHSPETGSHYRIDALGHEWAPKRAYAGALPDRD